MQGISKSLCAAVCVLALSACSSTKPLAAAGIEYRLPRTDATVTLGLELRSCAPFEMEGELKVAAKAGAQDRLFYLDGQKLSSARIKRELKVTVSDDRVLMAVNAASADQTPAIIGNYVKAILAVAVALRERPAFTPTCQPGVVAALARVKVIKAQMLALSQRLAASAGPTPTPQDLKYIREINTLAREQASLQTAILQVELSTDIKLDQEAQSASPQPLALKPEPLKKWFVKFDPKAWDEYLGLQWTAKAVSLTKDDALVEHSSRSSRARECGLAIKVPMTRLVQVEVGSKHGQFVDLKGSVNVPVAQWNDPAALCLDVGFGESRSVSLAFDRFGQTKDFSWATDAQAAGASAALPGIATDAMALRKSIQGPTSLERQKAEIDALETQQKLNQLRACRAILDAGGFNCDDAKAEAE